ncbi:MAG: RHS repeat-associated core domain-containing protein [Rhodocyclaceae bacterium]
MPLAQAVHHRPMALHRAPHYDLNEPYELDDDPLWTTEYAPEDTPFEALGWYQCDHLGTPQELTDEHGQIAWSAHYKAWGQARQVISEAARRAGLRNPLRFQGQYEDHETGLHYNRHRYYDPGSGRFVSRDPIGLAGGINAYGYAPNPLKWVDPLGLEKIARGMVDDDGSPKVGPSARELGARPGTDIKVDSNGNVHPNSGGISVAPNPDSLPRHRKPPEFGGIGKDPVWEIDTSDLGNDLKHVPDSPFHGTIQPRRTMSLEEYQEALASTKDKWKSCL